MSFRVLTKREYFPHGPQFEGKGVAPDMPVPLRLSELLSGSDEQLETAARQLLRSGERRASTAVRTGAN